MFAPVVAAFAPPRLTGAAPGWLPPELRVYALGDIRGAARALRAICARVAADLASRPVAQARLVLLGDYIGHGPDSAGVLALLSGTLPAPLVALRGDRDQLLLDALAGSAPDATDFRAEGGAAALASWGIPPDAPAAHWHAAIPPEQIAFLRATRLWHRAGGYVFVHAGVRPGVALSRQLRADLLSIRHPFLDSAAAHGAVVVHGHSVVAAPELRANRIGLDTGAGVGGRLCCAVLEGESVDFLFEG